MSKKKLIKPDVAGCGQGFTLVPCRIMTGQKVQGLGPCPGPRFIDIFGKFRASAHVPGQDLSTFLVSSGFGPFQQQKLLDELICMRKVLQAKDTGGDGLRKVKKNLAEPPHTISISKKI